MGYKHIKLPRVETECMASLCVYSEKAETAIYTCKNPAIAHENSDAYCHNQSRRSILENYLIINKNRGGKRQGAGRPLSNKKRIKSSFTIKPDLLVWVKSQPESMSDLVNRGLELLKTEIINEN